MKVKQLIEILSKIDPELDVYLNTAQDITNKNLSSVVKELSYGYVNEFNGEKPRNKTIVILRQKPFELGGGE